MAWGGARKGSGRKPKAAKLKAETAPSPAPEIVDELAGKSPEEIMDLAMRALAALGDFRGAAQAAARLAAAKARVKSPSASGKKEAAHAAALDRAHGASPFAVPRPPKTLN